MASLTRWTWVWVSSGSWWWTGRPGVLRFMGSQGVGHDWATELNWTTSQAFSHLPTVFLTKAPSSPHHTVSFIDWHQSSSVLQWMLLQEGLFFCSWLCSQCLELVRHAADTPSTPVEWVSEQALMSEWMHEWIEAYLNDRAQRLGGISWLRGWSSRINVPPFAEGRDWEITEWDGLVPGAWVGSRLAITVMPSVHKHIDMGRNSGDLWVAAAPPEPRFAGLEVLGHLTHVSTLPESSPFSQVLPFPTAFRSLSIFWQANKSFLQVDPGAFEPIFSIHTSPRLISRIYKETPQK